MTTTVLRETQAGWLLPFAATLIAMFTLQLSNLGFSPLLPSIQQEFGMSYTQLGLFTGLYGLLAMLLSVPAGVSARRFGEKRVLGLGLLGVAAGSVMLGEAWSFESALTFRGLTIFGYRFAFVSVLIAVALTAPASLRGRTMGILGATSALASVVGAPLGGLFVDEFGWRLAILGYAVMAVLGATVFWLFYRPTSDDSTSIHERHAPGGGSGSAFLSPVVWMLALVVGLGGFGQFTVTNFVPSVANALYGLDAKAAGVIISTGYLTAIAVNLGVGLLADRFNKLIVLGALFILLAVASSSLAIENALTFRIATAAVIGLGFTAANQLYGLAGSVMPRHEAGHAMGVVSLGAGLFGYFGPQMLGILRDQTGSFAAGFYMVAIADVITLVLIAVLYQMTRGETHR
ncbi:MAG TPA: MFS transporter [Vicinamibacterales bacterium]|nr:MFS transporter [Vicinamibacterales bacterium]